MEAGHGFVGARRGAALSLVLSFLLACSVWLDFCHALPVCLSGFFYLSCSLSFLQVALLKRGILVLTREEGGSRRSRESAGTEVCRVSAAICLQNWGIRCPVLSAYG
eukprot:559351-Rhodomonas_salina.1